MTRWGPDARGRLQQAAMELFSKRGYEVTTVAAIAERAGLTERTFFRHFADKREVLFGGSDNLRDLLVSTVAAAPASAAPIEAVAAGIAAAATVFSDERRNYSRQRQAIIAANAELRERELIKLATLGSDIADALRRRGVPDQAASLTAEAGMGVFRVAFERWVDATEGKDWAELVRESLSQLKALVSVSG
ncbi:MAG TPA: TetR family transcriptional regulator [Candidatus Dormibacteraeota bacterium]|nr:TetR family transcriptional regulator [Candidatus Dormibacteraeota bacterium]